MADETKSKVLRIVRRFEPPLEESFLLSPGSSVMKTWMFEEQDTQYDVDLRAGGAWTITNRRDGAAYVATGRYIEVVPQSRLVYTYAMPQFSPNRDTIAVELARDGDGCKLTFVESGEDISNELQQLSPGEKRASEIGWEEGFEQFAFALDRTRRSQ